MILERIGTSAGKRDTDKLLGRLSLTTTILPQNEVIDYNSPTDESSASTGLRVQEKVLLQVRDINSERVDTTDHQQARSSTGAASWRLCTTSPLAPGREWGRITEARVAKQKPFMKTITVVFDLLTPRGQG